MYSTISILQATLQIHKTLFKYNSTQKQILLWSYSQYQLRIFYALGPVFSFRNNFKDKNDLISVFVKFIIWEIIFLQKASILITKGKRKEFER